MVRESFLRKGHSIQDLKDEQELVKEWRKYSEKGYSGQREEDIQGLGSEEGVWKDVVIQCQYVQGFF